MLIGLGTALFGAIKAGKEKKKMEALIAQQSKDNETWYKANALGDYMQRADSQNLLRNLRENLLRQNKTAQNAAVIGGATPEQIAVQKEQASKVMSYTYANLGAMGQQYKDQINNQYLMRKDAISNRNFGMYEQTKANYDNLFANGIDRIGSQLDKAGEIAMKAASGGMG